MKELFSEMEREAMEMMIASEHTLIGVDLREQLSEVVDVKVEPTGVGFFKRFERSSKAKPLPRQATFLNSNVSAGLEDRNDHCIFFVFHIVNGFLHTLESVTTADEWPENLGLYKLAYTAQVIREQVLSNNSQSGRMTHVETGGLMSKLFTSSFFC